MKARKPERIPNVSSEAEERTYWERTDSADKVDWTKARRVRFPNL